LKRGVLCLLLCASLDGSAQTPLSDTLKQLQSRNWTKRSEAVDLLESHPEWRATPQAKGALLDLLDRENKGDATPGSGFGVTGDEGHAEYYSRVLGLVDSFVNSSDRHAVTILAHSSYNPDSDFGVKLASYGETVVAPLLWLSQHQDPGRSLQRANAYWMLGFVLQAHRRGVSRHPLSAHSAVLVEARLHEGLRDRVVVTRMNAIYGIVAAGDTDVLPVLEQLARTDPGGSRQDDGTTRYYVREVAARAIASLKSNVKSR
jgi:hypothetical protein